MIKRLRRNFILINLLRVGVSSTRSPAASCSPITSPCRRVSARTRASSSPMSKGLVI